MAIHANSTPAPLSHLFTDPLVRRAFERVERDDGLAGVIAARPRPRLSGGSAAGLLRGRRRAPLTRRQALGRLPASYPENSGVVDEAALLRHSIETAIDRLIAILDALDAAGEDLEDDDDRELEDEHGTDLDGGEADPSDYRPWNGVWRDMVARFEMVL